MCNCRIFARIFSRDNPYGICKPGSITRSSMACVATTLVIGLMIVLIYFGLIGLGFLTSYILNHDTYDILSGCPLSDSACKQPQIFCNTRDNNEIYGGCFTAGLLTIGILIMGTIIVVPILWYIFLGIGMIVMEIHTAYASTEAVANITQVIDPPITATSEAEVVMTVVELEE